MIAIGVLSISISQAQNINDALRYNTGELIGSARFQAMSGAFGALGGDLSAINLNPAGAAIFANSHASISLATNNKDNETNYFNNTTSNSKLSLNIPQGGGVIIFKNRNNDSKWQKFALSLAYDNSKNYKDEWTVKGNGNTSIGDYFLANAQGLRLDQISALDGESTSDAYAFIGSDYGYQNQQAFLGYDSYILEPATNDDNNTLYTSNIAGNNFNQTYNYSARGRNGKVSINIAGQYNENLYLGANLNSHFIDYERQTNYTENNTDTASTVQDVNFNNTMSVNGSGFSFQLGAIYKITNQLRAGLTYDSPTWMTIEEETSQNIETYVLDPAGDFYQNTNPNTVNIFPSYNLRSPSKITGSLAYIFGTQGLISFDYSRRDFSKTKLGPASDSAFSEENTTISNTLTAASTYKVGAEYKVDAFSLRGGYRLEESPYKDGKTIGDLTGYSLGVGYNFGNSNLDLAYSNSSQDRTQQLSDSNLSAPITTNNSNITLTYGFRL